VHDSIVGSTFRCTVVGSLTADGHPAVIPQITGMAYRCGTSEFTFDPRDPFVPGFVLRCARSTSAAIRKPCGPCGVRRRVTDGRGQHRPARRRPKGSRIAAEAFAIHRAGYTM
jgi:hypothetical protein